MAGIRRSPFCWLIAISFILSGCEHISHDSARESDRNSSARQHHTATTWAGSSTPDSGHEHEDHASRNQPRQRIVEIGERPLQHADMTHARASDHIVDADGEITLNFQDTDIREFIHALLGDLLNLNYLIDPQVAGIVTIHTTSPVKKADLFPLIEDILAINGASLVETDNLYQVVPRSRAIRGNLAPATRTGRAGYSVRIAPLEYIAASEMQKILEPFVTDGAEVRADANRNMLILSGTTRELDTLQETISIFDVDWLRGMSFGLYPLEHTTARSLKAEIEAVLLAMQSDEHGSPLHGLIRIVPLERLNSLLLIGATPAALREAELWLYRLDKPGETLDRSLHVYRLKNAKAIDLADILSQAFSSSRDHRSDRSMLAPGLEPIDISTPGVEDFPEERRRSTHLQRSELGVSWPSGEAVEIIADDVRNALVILATPRDYKMVKAAVEQLDVIPLQVLIEASIIEVTLTDDLNYGVEWFFKNAIGSRQGQGLLDLGAAGIGPLAPAFSYTVTNQLGDVRFVINTLAEKTDVNVLSSPSLMVLDNQTAHINVGDEIPVPSRQSVSVIDPDAPVVNEIQFRRTGVTLDVTPRVNQSGLVTLEIRQEVSNAVVTTSSNIDAPTIQQRAIESRVAVHDGDTIVLGGLIRDSHFQDSRGIPILHTIPIIGNLFGARGREYTRTELLVLLTPRVVRDGAESRAITDEFRRKLRGIQPFNITPAETGS